MNCTKRTQINQVAVVAAGYGHSSIATPDGSIVLMGGYHSGYMNDIWRPAPAGSSEQSPSHSCTRPEIFNVTLQEYNAVGYNSIPKDGYITVTSPETKIGVFRPSTHMFYLDYNGNGIWDSALIDRSYNFGLTGDFPVAGRW